MIITGAIYPAVDMTAGEKERSTLETLIGCPVRSIEIITGKFLAVATWAIGNAALNVISVAVTIAVLPLPSGEFQFPWNALPLTLLLLLPLTLFFAAMLLAIASFASNHKEAQVYCLPVFMVPFVGLMATIIPGVELEGPLLIAPILNVALLIKEVFLGHATLQQIVFVFLSTCLYAAGMVALAARIFAREEVLFSAQGSLRLFLSRRFFKPTATPSFGDSLLVAALLFPINFYVQMWLGKVFFDPANFAGWRFAALVLIPQVALFIGLPIAVAWYLKTNLKNTFQWRMPKPRAWAGALCLGFSAFVLVNMFVLVQSKVWTPAKEMDFLKAPIEALSSSGWGMALLVGLIGLTPAICEEHFFRGFFQQGLSRSKKWAMFLLVGFIFGAFHCSLFKLPILMLMGTMLAYVAYETRSIWPGVVVHFLHNSLTTVAGSVEKNHPDLVAATVSQPGVVAAVALFALGMWLVRARSLEKASTTVLPRTADVPLLAVSGTLTPR